MARFQIQKDSEAFDRLARWLEDPETTSIKMVVQNSTFKSRLSDSDSIPTPMVLLKRNEGMWSLPLTTEARSDGLASWHPETPGNESNLPQDDR